MTLPLFYHPQANKGEQVNLDESNTKHAIQVLRMQPGDHLQLTNGAGLLWTGSITQTGKKQCMVTIEQEESIKRLTNRKVAIAISPVKNAGRFEWFLEKATELGVAEIFPVKCHRTVKEHFRMDRMNQICISAMLQSRQAWLPVLHNPATIEDFLNGPSCRAYRNRWIAHCEHYEKHNLSKIIQPNMPDSLLLIGPEGDFTTEEIFEATNDGFIAVSLGETRLRTETAGMVGAALMCLC
ncbi:MAG: 16S rRNA (uracil(1498)-N(3))-methyltransferase [Chitinophagaceae bacterium]|nr:16S rRNA (uracil(1498)-N(3))-methyltransferase [Chitinophagaceae bacterium]